MMHEIKKLKLLQQIIEPVAMVKWAVMGALLFLLIIFMTHNVYASEEIMVVYGQENKINISSNHVNRLSFGSRFVKAIVGDDNKYNAILQHNNSEVFVTSKLEAPETIHLSFILTDGTVIDVAASVLDKAAPSIIDFVFVGNREIDCASLEVSEMINAMQQGCAGKYYVRHVNNPFYLDRYLDIRFTEKERYQYEKYRGVVIEVDRKGNNCKSFKSFTEMEKEQLSQKQLSKLLTKKYQSTERIEFATLDARKALIYLIYKEGGR